ncbi:MAG TPA: sialidase family protein [Balneolales bacterium]|nr:sialidase family protein [Balneolales bacterium]
MRKILIILFAASMGLMGCQSKKQNRWKTGIVKDEFIFKKAPFQACHASTIVETKHGLMAAWFGGKAEGNPNVGIWVSRKDNGTSKWSTPVEVATGKQKDGKEYPCWNPVLYYTPHGKTLLFYKVGPHPASWWGMLRTSNDDGKTWSGPKKLPKGILGPIKDKPVLLKNGDLLCGSSTENHGWQVHFELTPDFGKTWKKVGPINTAKTFNAIQPTILFHKDGRLQALCRSKNRAILQTWSSDNGKTWSKLTKTNLPNNDSGIDAITLKDGRQLLVYNNVLPPDHKANGPRSPLNVAVSKDGKTWYAALVLENTPNKEFSYPAVIQTHDGLVHMVYTWKRKRIKHVVIDPSKLQLTKIINGKWPAN